MTYKKIKDMQKQTNRILRSSLRTALLPIAGCFILLLAGCGKEETLGDDLPTSPKEETDGGELVPVQVSVAGVDEYFGGGFTRSDMDPIRIVQPLDSTYDTGYDVETVIEPVPLANPVQTRATLANIRFRVVAYKDGATTADNYAGTAVYRTNGSGIASLVAGTATPVSENGLWLLPNGSYTFVCYSYGVDSNPAMLASNWSTAVTANQDFMLYRKENAILTPGQTFTLSDISFTRQSAQLQICVKTDGEIFALAGGGKVQQCAASVSNMSTSTTWNASQASVPNTGTNGALAMTWSTLNSTTVYSNYYKILPQNNRALTVKLTTLRINNVQYNNAVTINANANTYVVGGNYRITVTVVSNGINLAGCIWAKGNLTRNGSSYYFENSTTAGGSYFGWNTLEISNSRQYNNANRGNYDYNRDPCSKVAPAGTWIAPSSTQLRNLINTGFRRSGSNGVFGGKLTLPTGGNIGRNGVNYWTSSGYYSSSTSSGSRQYFIEFNSSKAILSTGYDRGDAFHMRCVKK